MSDLTIAVPISGETTVLELRGELDLASAHQLRRNVRAVLLEHDPTRLVLDLSGLTFTDSMGLSVMVWAHQRMTERGHTLFLVAPRPTVVEVLRVTGLDKRLNIQARLPGDHPVP
jgi:anti-sigma B factor antagonist